MPAGDLAAVLDFHRWESPTLLIPSDENNLEERDFEDEDDIED